MDRLRTSWFAALLALGVGALTLVEIARAQWLRAVLDLAVGGLLVVQVHRRETWQRVGIAVLAALPFIVVSVTVSEATSADHLDFLGGFIAALFLGLAIVIGTTVYRRMEPKP